ncbi:MAG: hypothetical protein RLZZ543_317 [Bacteroidota bacterium]|jgi:hypothetical protein
MSPNQAFIPGIFNYCDSWCSRCSHQRNCAVFSMMGAQQESEGTWKSVFRILEESEYAFDSDSLHLNELEEKAPSPILGNEALSTSSEAYIPLYEKHARNIEKAVMRAAMTNTNISASAAAMLEQEQLKNAFEIIRHFAFFIPAKINRAIHQVSDEEMMNVQSDANGSCKVVLLAIQECDKAFTFLLYKLTSEKEALTEMRHHLLMLKEQLSIRFPHCMKFVRPGFDTIQVN